MQIQKLVLKDVLRFTGETTLDFSTLPPGLIALVGPNGAGKTSLLETVPGALYLKLPSRRDGAHPAQYARSREAALDVTFAVGAEDFHARVNIDGQTRAADAVLEQIIHDDDGPHGVPLNDGKVSTFKRVIAEKFPSFDLFLTSAFAAQGKGNRLATMTSGEGQALFAEFLGLEHYAAMADTAKKAVAKIDARRIAILAELRVLEQETTEAIDAALTQRREEIRTTSAALEHRRDGLTALLTELEARLATVDDTAAAFFAACQKLGTLSAEADRWQTERHRLVDAIATAERTRQSENASIRRDLEAALQKLDDQIAANQELRGMAEAIRAAVTTVTEVSTDLDALRGALELQQAAVDSVTDDDRETATREAQASAAKGALDRAQRALQVLQTVPFGDECSAKGCQFVKDATAAKAQIPVHEAAAAPLESLMQRRMNNQTLYLNAKSAVTETTRKVKEAEARLKTARETAAYADKLAAADARIEELEQKKRETRDRAAEAFAAADARHQTQVASHEQRQAEVLRTLAQLDQQIEAAERERDDSEGGKIRAAQLQQQLAQRRTERDDAIARLARLEGEQADVERRRTAFEQQCRRRDERQRHLAALDTELLEWQTLATVFSRDGLPDLEIDAAGPTIATTTNDILAACFGPRFTVDLVTQVPKADGKGMKGEFSIRVLDNDAPGDWRDLSDLSGGEKVIVCEALMNAIAIYVNARSPMPIRTLWRDETGAALDPENALRYVAMLRKVRELAGVHHVFFISHNLEAAALADAQVQIADGQARVVLPPFTEAA